MITPDEGVIKFNLAFGHAPAQALDDIAELNAWRQILFRLGLTGRDPARYGGLAYGNVSQRIGPRRFIISGTQTGAKECLSCGDYCLVLDFDIGNNSIRAEGPVEPSSEALSHGAIYGANPSIGCVIHIHSPEIWRNAQGLGIPVTDKSFAYGTPEMGYAVGEAAAGVGEGLIVMGGHEDGVLAFAGNAGQAAVRLLRCLAKAVECGQHAKAGEADGQSS